MGIEYIIVQAGGRGSRLEYLTDNKPKALVPIDNKPMIFHLFDKYPDKRFIVIADYKKEVMKKYLDAFSKVKHIVVDAKGKKGTCAGMKNAVELIPENAPFMIIWSDLILSDGFSLPNDNTNYVGLSSDFECRWRYENGKFEEIKSVNTGVAGLFVLNDKNILKDVPEEGEFVRWLGTQDILWDSLSIPTTKEYGLLSVYQEKQLKKKEEGRCRAFNSMTIKRNTIVKTGIDQMGKQLAMREKKWYSYVMEKNFDAIPYIYSFEPFEMEKIDGKNVFCYDLDYSQKVDILKKIVSGLHKLHNYDVYQTDYFSIYEAYVGKTFSRLEKIRDLVPFSNDKTIVINGTPCKNVFFYKEQLEELFRNYKCKQFHFIHGDNTFSNMMLDKDLNPKFIDPRGYFGFTELYGDANYDWAKLYYSIVGNYDQFNLGNFRLKINEADVKIEIESNKWESLEDKFFDLVGEELRNDIKLLHAVIWLSLTTYAWEDYDSVCGAFYNGLLYLNEVLYEEKRI